MVSVSVWEEQGVLTPLFANGLSLRDALENIRYPNKTVINHTTQSVADRA